MRKISPTIHTIRFRRWSRKSYAAFVSIGQCVTIGCLRKSVADSSLSKQKVAGTAGHVGYEKESIWKRETVEKENDMSIPPSSSAALTGLLTQSGMTRYILFEAQVIHPYIQTGRQEKYILKQERTRGTDYRKPCSRIISYTAPVIRTSIFTHKLNPRKI